jgi:uncharacterized alkaline shock family protein YloU
MSELPLPASGLELTELVVAGEVVAAVGAHAAAATAGVVRLEDSLGKLVTGLGRSARQRIAGITPAPVTGTSVVVSGSTVRLRVEVAVSGDYPAVVTAAAVQRSVARAVARATGLTVAGVDVTILDVSLGRLGGERSRPRPPAGDEPGPADGLAPGLGTSSEPAGRPGSRSQACALVLDAVRSVPGLRPASPVRPVRPEHARWMHWDPAALAVELGPGQLEVHLAATRLPLPVLLEQAAAAIRLATAPTAWGLLPHRLVVAALDAAALIPANLAVRP